MDQRQILDRCPSARFRQPAVMHGYRLGFTRYSQKRLCGVADLIPDAAEEVWGAVFEINEHDLERLDRNEGVHLQPPAYQRMTAKVFGSSTKEWLSTVTYEVAKKSLEHLKPNAAYMALIVSGAVKWGLPQPYIEKLKQIEVC